MEVVRAREKDPYRSYRKTFSECVVKPFLMGMAAALGLSVGTLCGCVVCCVLC